MSRLPTRWFTVAACALSVLTAGDAMAQPTAAPASPEESARTLFDEAKQLRTEGKWREACDKFEQANRAFPTGGTTFAVADCADREGRIEEARALYQKVLDDPANKDNVERTTIATNRIKELDKQLAAAKNKVPADNGDGAAKKPEPKHIEPEPTSSPRRPNLVPGAIVLGVGGGVLIVGVALGGVALAKANKVKAACTGNICPADQEAPAKSAKGLALAADISYGIGAAAAVAGVVMLVTLKHPATTSSVQPTANGFLVRF